MKEENFSYPERKIKLNDLFWWINFFVLVIFHFHSFSIEWDWGFWLAYLR